MTLTRDELLEDAIRWMARRIDDARARPARENAEAMPQPSLSARVKDLARTAKAEALYYYPIVEVVVGADHRVAHGAPKELDQHTARAQARRRVLEGAAEAEPALDTAREIAAALCEDWKQAPAAPLARAWLDESDFDVESLMNTDEKTLVLLVAVASAAAILAVVWLVRRGQTVRVPPRRDLAQSADFAALAAVVAGQGEAASVAARIKSSVVEPWAWTAREGLGSLTVADKRVLLSAFAELGACGVQRIAPIAGDSFDIRNMTASIRVTKDDHWVVSQDSARERHGFLLGERVEVPAEVEACTVDWWVLSKPSCPVGRAISERADQLVAGGGAKAPGWRAPWGLAYPEDLRKLAVESSLDAWRQRLVNELNPYYVNHPERCVALVGKPGDVFEVSTMEAEGAPPVGDAVVAEVVEREGVPQLGLACPGGSPLLLAVVRTRPARA